MRAVTEQETIALDELRRMAARPSFGNRSRGVDDPSVRERIASLVGALVER